MSQLRIRRGVRVLLGLVVLAALGLGLGRVFVFLGKDPQAGRFEFYLLFKDVQGLRQGSRVVCRGMSIGEVGGLSLDVDAGWVRVHCRVDAAVARLIRTTTKAWVVRPRFALGRGSVTGLDTLVKESYLRLLVPNGGSPLKAGNELLGLSGPPGSLPADLPRRQKGDLAARVVVPDAHGLRSGAVVACCGLEVGTVLKVELASDGQGVIVSFTVKRIYRSTVREKSRFWIARPSVSGGMIKGLAVQGLGHLLSPALCYDSPRGKEAGAAADNMFFRGIPEPPQPAKWKPEGNSVDPVPVHNRKQVIAKSMISPWVEVTCRAIEKDTFTTNDPLEAEGPGLLYRDAKNRLLCLTGRSNTDFRFSKTGHWYDRLRLSDERIRVKLEDGRILPARHLWQHEKANLALLVIELPGCSLPSTSGYLRFSQPPDAKVANLRSGKKLVLLKQAGLAWGVAGQGGDMAVFEMIPARLRPGGK